MSIALALLALLAEALFGYPQWLGRAIGHPVSWMGRLINLLDGTLNQSQMSPPARRAAGALALVIIIIVVAILAHALERSLLALPLGIIAAALAASALVAQRSLYRHVALVAAALEQEGLVA